MYRDCTFPPQIVCLTIWLAHTALYFLSLHVCILEVLFCTQYCFRKHKVHVVVLKWNLTPFVCDTGFFHVFTCVIRHVESICGSQFGCSSRSDSRLALFVLARRRRHISLVDTPLLQGSYCGARGPGQQRLNSQFAVISLNLPVHWKYQSVCVSDFFFLVPNVVALMFNDSVNCLWNTWCSYK